jgi:hypothetical protein
VERHLRVLEGAFNLTEGIDIDGFLSDELINEMLHKLFWAELEGRNPCFCVHLFRGEGRLYFRPFGKSLPSVGHARPHLPLAITFEHFVGKSAAWPMIGVNTAGLVESQMNWGMLDSEVGSFLQSVRSHAQLRIQEGMKT